MQTHELRFWLATPRASISTQSTVDLLQHNDVEFVVWDQGNPQKGPLQVTVPSVVWWWQTCWEGSVGVGSEVPGILVAWRYSMSLWWSSQTGRRARYVSLLLFTETKHSKTCNLKQEEFNLACNFWGFRPSWQVQHGKEAHPWYPGRRREREGEEKREGRMKRKGKWRERESKPMLTDFPFFISFHLFPQTVGCNSSHLWVGLSPLIHLWKSLYRQFQSVLY